jgi:hypothetical protein
MATKDQRSGAHLVGVFRQDTMPGFAMNLRVIVPWALEIGGRHPFHVDLAITKALL